MANNHQLSVESLAAEIQSLSVSYQPQQWNAGQFGIVPPIATKALELIDAASTANDHASILIFKACEMSVIRALLSLNAIQSIPDEGSISLADLATKTGASPGLLDRLIRILTSAGIMRLTATGEYAHTLLSRGYAHETGQLFAHVYDESIASFSLHRYLAARGLSEPISPTHNPSTWYENQEGKTVFEIVSQNPSRVAGMQHMMQAVSHLRPYTGFYDYSRLVDPNGDAHRPVFVDVGGGAGHVIAHVLQAHPDIQPEQCVLEDRPEVIEYARTHARAPLPAGVKFVAQDFFATQLVENARAYHLRAVLHDWSDETSEKILGPIVKVMARDSKVLIGEVVLRDEGSRLGNFMDLMMMGIGGKDRTARQWETLLDRVGLRIANVWRADGVEWAIIEAELKEDTVSK